jgi:hypothetical protein
MIRSQYKFTEATSLAVGSCFVGSASFVGSVSFVGSSFGGQGKKSEVPKALEQYMAVSADDGVDE